MSSLAMWRRRSRAGASGARQGTPGTSSDASDGTTEEELGGHWVRSARLDDEIALAAQSGGHQPVVHGTGGEQRVHGDLALHQVAIRQQDHQLAFLAHRFFSLRADAQDGVLHVFLRRVVLQVDEFVADAVLFH